MTPAAVALWLALTWLTCTILDWLIPFKDRRPVVIIALVAFFIWVIGVPLLVVRG